MQTNTRDLWAYIVILIGIWLRFYFQFIEWSFNGDEITTPEAEIQSLQEENKIVLYGRRGGFAIYKFR